MGAMVVEEEYHHGSGGSLSFFTDGVLLLLYLLSHPAIVHTLFSFITHLFLLDSPASLVSFISPHFFSWRHKEGAATTYPWGCLASFSETAACYCSQIPSCILSYLVSRNRGEGIGLLIAEQEPTTISC